MAITPRVKAAPPPPGKAPVDEAAIEAIINKGGTPAGIEEAPPAQSPAKDDTVAKFTLRVPRRMLDAIEADIEERTGTSAGGKVNAWILETINDRLRRRGDG